MNLKKTILISTALIACSSNVFAGNTAELKVVGEITPPACTPAFTGGGTVNFGQIDNTTLSTSAATQLPQKTVPYTVNCTSPVKVALKLIDNRNSSAYSDTVSASADLNDQSVRYGLGMDGVNKIGFYSVQNSGTKTTDGVTVDAIYSSDNGISWGAPSSTAARFQNNATSKYSYATTGSIIPLAGRVFSGEFELTAFIAPTSKLDLSNAIKLDGLATLEISYL